MTEMEGRGARWGGGGAESEEETGSNHQKTTKPVKDNMYGQVKSKERWGTEQFGKKQHTARLRRNPR